MRFAELDEAHLRKEACEWLKANFPTREYLIAPIVFHNIGLTLTQYVKKKYKGKELACIPKYDELPIRPDVIALAVINKNKEKTFGWIIGECKVSSLSVADLRQGVYYAYVAEAYEAYLFHEGSLSKEVRDLIKTGGHLYVGINKWGRDVKKRLAIKTYENGRFTKTLY